MSTPIGLARFRRRHDRGSDDGGKSVRDSRARNAGSRTCYSACAARTDGARDHGALMFLAHDEIEKRWDDLVSGDTIDVTPRWEELEERLARLMAQPDEG